MNHQDDHHQAEQLEKIFQEVKKHEDEYNDHEYSVVLSEDTEYDHQDIDVLNLPPRSEVHNIHDQGWKFKLSKATWRFILIIFVLLVIAMFILYDVLFLKRIVLFTEIPYAFVLKLDIFSFKWR